MKALTLSLIFLTTLFTQAEENLHLWILRTDNKTTESITTASQNPTLTSDKFHQTLTKLIKGRKIQELANFKGKQSDKRIDFILQSPPLHIAELNENVPMGYQVHIESAYSYNAPMFHATITAEFNEKINKRSYFHYLLQTSKMITPNRWELVHQWQGTEQSTLLLALLNHPTTDPNSSTYTRIETHAALYATTSADLARFNKSTPATRQKALDWLKSRAELLSATTLDSSPGSTSNHANQVFWIYEQGGLTTSDLGFNFKSRCHQYSPVEQKIDISYEASWSKPDKPKSKKDYTFEISETLTPNQTYIYHPTTKLKDADKELVLLITPTLTNPKKPKKLPTPPTNQTEIYTAQYRLPVNFYRTHLEKFPAPGNPAGNPFAKKSSIPNPQHIKDILRQTGLQFPQDTTATLNKSTSILNLRHTQKGHAILKSYLESLK